MDKNSKKKLEVLRKRHDKLRQQLTGAKSQMDDPGEVETIEKQIVVSKPNVEYDIYGFWQEKHSVALSVLHVRNGIINGYQHYYFKDPVGSDMEIMAEVLERFYAEDRDVPREILLSFAQRPT